MKTKLNALRKLVKGKSQDEKTTCDSGIAEFIL